MPSGSSDPPWRYGVALFPVPVVVSLLSYAGLAVFVSGVDGGAGVRPAVPLMAFALTTLAPLVGLVVLVALVLDARALRGSDAGFAPRPAFAAGVGVVHVVASAFAPLYVVSVPALTYYTYRRFG